jgi:cytochrome c oxidase assembly protein subunit 11
MAGTGIRRRNGATAAVLGAVVVGMVGLAFASVPLYRVFCAATGFGGTTQRATAAPERESADIVNVRFDADTAPGLGWEFYPLTREVKVHLGERRQVFFRAINRTPRAVTARAVYNVTPTKTGIYFDKLQCFCFDEQTLKSGESRDMGVVFFVDPDLMRDRSTSEVRTITLSYTMLRAADANPPTASAVN